MAGYTRQSAANMVTDAVIYASDFNAEFNAIQAAFNGSTGHTHDGSTGNGPKIDLTASVANALPIANGGTNATTAADARTSLGLAIGTNVQAYDAGLQSISGLTTAADRMIYTTASDTYAVTTLTSFARTLLDDTDASTARTTLGVALGTNVQAWDANLDQIAALTPNDSTFIVGDGSAWVAENASTARTSLGLGTMAIQNATSVAITGGSITGITDLAVADGGTGASTAADARTNLGLAIGTNVQAYNAGLADISGLAKTDNNFIVANGTNWVAESGATARTSLGVAIGTDVQAWDTNLDQIAALAVTDSNFIVGNGSAWVAESGATARTSLGLGSLATLSTVNDSNWSGTDLAIANGGTGASDAATARANIGSMTLISSGSIPLTAAVDLAVTSGPKRFTLYLIGYSTNGTSVPAIRLKSGGVAEVSGYTGASANAGGAASVLANSTGFTLNGANSATLVYNLKVELTLISGSSWVMTGLGAHDSGPVFSGGSKTLAGAIDGIRLTTLGGVDVPDSGSYALYAEY